jgi:predicted RNase H-like HicB family nuclease
LRYAVVIERGPESFGASVPDLPGCFAVGDTLEEVERLIEEAIAAHIALLRQRGQPVPAVQTHVCTVDVG